jgi:PAS domain S-box-containing protein
MNKRIFNIKRPYAVQWLILTFALFAILSILVRSLYMQYGLIKENEQDRLLGQARVVEQVLNASMTSLNALFDKLRNEWEDGNRDEWKSGHFVKGSYDWLGNVVKGMTGVRTIVFMDKHGKIIAASNPAIVGSDFSHREYFWNVRENPSPNRLYIGEPFPSVIDGTLLITVGKMLQASDGRFDGVILASLDPRYFAPLMRSVKYADDMSVALVHGRGIMFMVEPNFDEDVLMRDISTPGSFFSKHVENGQKENVSIAKEYFTGQQVMVATLTIRPTGGGTTDFLVVAAARDLGSIFSHYYEDIYRSALGFLMFVLLSVGGLYTYQHSQMKLNRIARETEEQNNLLLHSLGEGVYGIDAQGNISFINPAGMRLLGFDDVNEVLGQNSHVLMHHSRPDGSAYPEHECPLRADAGKGKFVSGEYEVFWRKDGSSFPVEYSSAPVFREGKPFGAVVIFTDISERRKAEKALRESERRYRELLEFLPDSVLVLDSVHAMPIEFNTVAHEQLGYSREEFTKISVQDIEALESPEKIAEHMAAIVETGRDDFETMHRRKDGSCMHVMVTAKFIALSGVPAFLAVFRDITDKKQAEEELKTLSERLRLATMSAGVGIWDYDWVNNILIWDDVMYFLYGIEKDTSAITHEDWESGVHPEDVEKIRLAVNRALGGEEDFSTEFRIIRRDDGFVRFIKGNAIVQWNENGEPSRMLGTNWDVTPLRTAMKELEKAKDTLEAQVRERTKELEGAVEELRVARDRAESSSRMKSDFLAAVSHEYRTPLNGILGMLDLLEEMELNEDQREYVTVARMASQRLKKMTDDILAVTSLEHYTPNMTPILTKSILDHHERNFSRAVMAKDLRLVIAASISAPEVILTDIKLLNIAIEMLMDNAVKFTSEGEIRLTLDVERQNQDRVDIVISITDTGKGIPKEMIKGVMEGLRQGDATLSRAFGGIGIGLEAVRKALYLLGGILSVESEEGVGTTMRIHLPTKHFDTGLPEIFTDTY